MSNSLISNAIYLEDVPKETLRQNYIGNGYRSICYTTDPTTKQGRIILFGFDKADNPTTYIIPWKSHVKYVVKYPTQELDIYDRYIATKEFNNVWERKKWLENAAGLKIVECFRPESEALHFLFDRDNLDENFNKQQIRIHYFDIETEISDQFEKPVDARNRINMMTIYDTKHEKFFTWSLEHADIQFNEEPLKDYPKDKFVFFEFHNDENAMLEHFLDWYEDNYPDVNFGWNTKAYDWPYVVRRIENTLGKGAAQRLSPMNKYFVKQVNHDNGRADVAAEIEVSIDGLFIADGLALYRDKFGLGKPDGGFTLDNIGETEGCGHKIQYEGTLKDLYIKDYQKFYEYNVRDVDLCMRIEQKKKMIPLARTITSFGLSQYPTIYSSISYLVGSVTSFAKTEMNRVMVSYVGEKKHFDGFEGAFVFPAQVGVFRGGSATVDFASLYPSNIRSINASPETYRGKVLINYKAPNGDLLPVNERDELPFDIFDDKAISASNIAGFTLKLPDGRRQTVDVMKLRAWIEKHGIYTANNTIFLKHEEKWGVVAKWCEYFYMLRKATKKKMGTIDKILHDKTLNLTEEERNAKILEYENLNSRQGAIKNMLNSVYGQMGSAYSPLANLDIAQSITRQGRMCNIKSSEYAVTYFRENFDPTYKGFNISVLDPSHPEYAKTPKIWTVAISGDTDSFFMDLSPVSGWMIKKYGLPKMIREWPADKQQELWKIINDFTEEKLNPFVRDLVHAYCHTNQQNVLKYEFEYGNAVLIMEGKKHYLGHKIYKEGFPSDELKITGISLKKNETDKAMKDFLKECYYGIIYHDWTEIDYTNYISECYEKFKTLKNDQIAFWKGYGTARESTGFLQMQKGATIISRACTYYNQIVAKLNINKKYDELRVGDKCRFLYVKNNNPYGVDVIAYKPGQWPKEFDKIFEIDYSVMFNKIMLDQLKRYREACGFADFDPKKQVIQDIFDL